MKTSNHRIVVLDLVDRHLDLFDSKIQKWLFVYGTMEPDYNFFTHLNLENYKIKTAGHDSDVAMRKITKMIGRQKKRQKLNFVDYYRVGKICHYCMDLFTFAHNTSFNVNFKDHVAYEKQLQDYVIERLQGYSDFEDVWIEGEDYLDALEKNHEKYLQNQKSMENDVQFIFNVVAVIMQTYFERKINRECIFTEKVMSA